MTESTSTTVGDVTTSPPLSDISTAALRELETEMQAWGISRDSTQCVIDGLVEGGFVQGLDDLTLLDTLFFDETEPLAEYPPELAKFTEGFFFYLMDPQAGCLRPAELTAVMENFARAADNTGLFFYGDDPTLDSLHDGCAAGSLADCDMLYLASDFGSPYEVMAVTCGGLVDPIDPTDTCMTALDDFSEAEQLAEQCTEGFYLACDAYFTTTLVGSAEEDLAASCGGLREPTATSPCWLTFGFGSR
jgi:hypothetical protein